MNRDYFERQSDVLKDGAERSFVELLDIMPHPSSPGSPDNAVVSAARVSYLGQSKGKAQDEKLIRYLLKNGHTSPFEQVELKFRVRAPVIVWWQWVRHRTWHYNFQSGRYTEFESDDFYIPNRWRMQSDDNKQMSKGLVHTNSQAGIDRRMRYLVNLGYESYKEAVGAGLAREQARLFLPFGACYYTAICKVDAWNLMHFLKLRLHESAQWEIRQYAKAMMTMFENQMPVSANAFWDYMVVAND